MPVSPDEFAFLKKLHGDLSDRPLEPDSRFYVPIHERNLQDDPVSHMAATIAFQDVESIQLFSGFRGAGKTTQLFRLKQHLEAQGYLVLYANALDYLNPGEPVDITDLLIVLAAAFGETLSERLDADVLRETFWDRLRNFLTRTEVRLTSAGANAALETPLGGFFGKLKAGMDLKFEIKTASSFRHTMQAVLANQLSDFEGQVVSFIEDSIKRVRADRGDDTKVVFLFDQLEQLRGGILTEQSVIASVGRIFTLHFDRLKLPYVHVVYTVPPWLKFVVPGMVEMTLLPTPHIWNNDPGRTITWSNWQIFRDVVLQRLGTDGARRLLGQDPAARERLIDQMVGMSGGHLRDLLRLLRETTVRAVSLPALPVPPTLITGTINAVRREMLPVAQNDAIWLARIAEVRATALPDTEPESVNRLSRFLDSRLVLYFVNDEEWYDIHPLIRDEVATVIAATPPPRSGT
jgi:hypothetical protein